MTQTGPGLYWGSGGKGHGWTHNDNDDTWNEHLQRKAKWPEGGGREDTGWSEAGREKFQAVGPEYQAASWGRASPSCPSREGLLRTSLTRGLGCSDF